jgi:hypothetical protein
MKNSLDWAPQMRQISKDLRWYCPPDLGPSFGRQYPVVRQFAR